MKATGIDMGDIVRFDTIIQRAFVGKNCNVWAKYKSPRGLENFALLLGLRPRKEPLPPKEEIVDRMNYLGWVNRDQLVYMFGRPKAEKILKAARAKFLSKGKKGKTKQQPGIRK